VLLIVPDKHPLAQFNEVRFDQIKEEMFIMPKKSCDNDVRRILKENNVTPPSPIIFAFLAWKVIIIAQLVLLLYPLQTCPQQRESLLHIFNRVYMSLNGAPLISAISYSN
jgi:hypothetical protein